MSQRCLSNFTPPKLPAPTTDPQHWFRARIRNWNPQLVKTVAPRTTPSSTIVEKPISMTKDRYATCLPSTFLDVLFSCFQRAANVTIRLASPFMPNDVIPLQLVSDSLQDKVLRLLKEKMATDKLLQVECVISLFVPGFEFAVIDAILLAAQRGD